MSNATCPTCRFVFPLPAPAARVECPQCFESFRPTAAPKPAAAHAPKNKADAPIPLAEVVDDDDIPVAKPVAAKPAAAKPVAKVVAPAAKPAKPAKPTPQERKTVGQPRAYSLDDDDEDEPRRKSARSGWKMIAAGVVGLFVVVGGSIGIVYAVREKPQVAAAGTPDPTPPAVAPVPPPEEPKKTPPGAPIVPGIVPPPNVFPPAGPPVERPFPRGGAANPPAPPKGPPLTVVAPAEVLPITPTAAADGAVVNLPAAFDKVCVGGGGRFLIFRLPSAKQIAVFDASLGKVAKYLPMTEEGGIIAAGMTKLFVAYPNNNVIQRWNLLNFERELTVPNPLGGTPSVALVGHQTDGPLFVAGSGVGGANPNAGFGGSGGGFINAQTMAVIPTPPNTGGGYWGSGQPQMRVSADGRVYTTSSPPYGAGTMILGESGPKTHGSGHSPNGTGTLIPGPDGTIFAAANVLTPEMKPISGPKDMGSAVNGFALPAVHGRFYLDLSVQGDTFRFNSNESVKLDMSVKMLGDTRPLFSLGRPAGIETTLGVGGFNAYGLSPRMVDRVFLIPSAELLVIANSTMDKLHLHSFNLKERLDRAGVDYLFVMSRPQPAVAGKSYRYVPDVWSKKGGVKIKLDAGPDGMQVIGNSVTWKVPADQTAAVDVILTVSDSAGQEVFHNFKLPVNDR